MTKPGDLNFTIENTKEAEKRQSLLYQIVSQSHTNLNYQLSKALELTAELLNMELGIISKIEGDAYIVKNFYAKDGGLEVGQEFELNNTYCAITLENKEVVAIEHMGKSPWNRHPCYEVFQLESYLGIPIYIDGEVYGTINFSSPSPKNTGFIPADENLIKLLSEWTGGIIKRLQVKEELSKQKELYELLSTNTADVICLHDSHGKYQFVSPSVETLLGYKPEELIGLSHYELIHPDDQEKMRETAMQRVVTNNTTQSIQYRIKTKEGVFIWFDTTVKPITNKDGDLVNIQTVSRDISERKKLEVLFAKAQQMANVGGWEYNLANGDLFWTDEVYRIHDKEIGEKVSVDEGVSYFPGEAENEIQKAIQYTIETGEQYDVILPFVSAKGAKKWVRALGKAEFNNGEAYKLTGAFQDISLQKENEEKINLQNQKLQALTENRDKLYSIIAHDLKGAFFGITGMLGLLKSELEEQPGLGDSFFKKFGLVESSSQQALRLFENLLAWSHMQMEDFKPNFTSFDMEAEINNVLWLFSSAAENKGVTISMDFKSSSEVHGDPSMISTVIRNLISNAIKFVDENGSVKVTISENKNDNIISVKDNGIGMPKEVKENLFNSGSRPKRKGTQNEKGTGLGMLLCKEMVDLHSGSIEVKSEVGKGTEFIVNLPKKN